MAGLKKLLDGVKTGLRPKKSLKEFKDVLSSIEKAIQKYNLKQKEKINIVVVFGGSIAKGTNIKSDFDCDIFMKFPIEMKDKDISSIAEKILKSFSPERMHGSRDYFKFVKNKIKYEIVPVLNINTTDELINTTDASPLHAEWVRDEIKKKPGLADDIRLTKQFCKSQGVYGAESYIRGFSGHVVDILTIYYGGFIPLLEASQKWQVQNKVVLDFYNFHKGKALNVLNYSKLDSPLIVIDPIEKQRNASASLSIEKLKIFIESAKNFLNHPDKSYFQKKEVTISELKKKVDKTDKNKILVLLSSESLEGKEDIIGTKLLKAYEYIINQAKANDFPIIESGWTWDKKKKAIFWIISENIESEKIWPGPPINVKNAVLAFKKKHKDTFEAKGRIFANVIRKYTNPEEFIKKIIKDKEVKGRVKKIKII